jgi:hypothetical protein
MSSFAQYENAVLKKISGPKRQWQNLHYVYGEFKVLIAVTMLYPISFWFIFHPDDGSDMFLLSFRLSTNYMTSQLRTLYPA